MVEFADILSVLSGALVGFVLGLLGGGGSILAVPLLIYVVGVKDTHIAIGTSAVAVSANAAIGLLGHAQKGHVKWPCAIMFAVFGILGAAIGSTIGKHINGNALLSFFAFAMLAVGANMLMKSDYEGDVNVRITPAISARLAAFGFVVGLAAGFFGVGGGFLIIPGLIAGASMAMLNAVGSSLLSVASMGATTAGNYALSGLVDWRIAALFIAGGVIGSFAGIRTGEALSHQKGLLSQIFAWMVIAAGLYVLYQAASDLMGSGALQAGE